MLETPPFCLPWESRFSQTGNRSSRADAMIPALVSHEARASARRGQDLWPLGTLHDTSRRVLYSDANMQERSTMSPNIRPAHPVFAGDVSAIDISQKLSQEQVAAIEAGMERYAVLVFRDQQLTDDQQLEFSRNFGELEVTLAGQMAKPEDRRLGDRLELGDISNLTAQNELRAREDRSRMYALANRLWHSDASFRAVGAGYTLLHGRVIPQKGGNTEFADMRAAYDALDASMKAQVESLVCEHSIVFSREQIGFSDYAPG